MAGIKLCLVSDDGLDDDIMLQRLEKALATGFVDLFQLRCKHCGDKYMLELALRAKKICRAYKVPIILDDRIDVAMAADVDGVHVGQDDLPASYARSFLGPGKILGVTAHNSQQALEAEKNGADYIGAGAIFSTTTKNNVDVMTLDTVKSISTSVKIPVLAIGGLNAENVRILSGASVSGICVAAAVMRADDSAAACTLMRKACEEMLNF